MPENLIKCRHHRSTLVNPSLGTCPNCGHKKLFLKIKRCVHCGKECCEKCGIYILSTGGINRFACSKQCAQKFEQKVLDYSLGEIGTELNYRFMERVKELWHEACIAALDINDPWRRNWSDWVKKKGKDIMLNQIVSKSFIGEYVSDLRDKFYERALLALANNMEAVERPLDAAMIYEKHLKMYEKARELRKKQKQFTLKTVEVSVDLNKLLQQVKDGGIVVVYRCPHCGGKLKIGKDTSVESLKVCQHCGSEIEVMDVAELLKTALS